MVTEFVLPYIPGLVGFALGLLIGCCFFMVLYELRRIRQALEARR